MPGITGIICQRPSAEAERDLAQMVAAMGHQSGYHSGQYVNRELGLHVGWVCRPDTSADCVPVMSRNKDAILIFHGENYPVYPDSCATATASGLRAESTANNLLGLYEQFGEEFVRHLNGWFCGIVADLRKRKVLLFNDRYGMGRLYVHQGKDAVLFGSEAKSLLKVRAELRAIDPEGLAQFLRCNCVMGNRTLFRDVALLPGSSLWSLNGQTVQKRRYFDFAEWESQDPLGPDEFYQQFASAMNRIVPEYAGNATQVALSLTAGLDTRAVMTSLHMRDRSFPCYTFGGTWGETFDIAIARKLAAVYNQSYQAIKLDGDFFKSFPALAEETIYISDGTHNAFGAHDLYFNRTARQVAPVRLTAKYGSEVVRGRKLIPFWSFPTKAVVPDLRPVLERILPPNQVNGLKHPLSRTVAESIPWYMSGRLTVEQSQLAIRTPFMDNMLVSLLFRASQAPFSKDDLQARYVNEYSPALRRIATDMGRLGTNSAVASSLTYRLQRTLGKVEYIYLYAMPHWATRVDRSFGFCHPERIVTGRHKYEWYRIWAATHFADFIRDTLLNSQADYTRYFDYRVLSNMVKCHTAGTHNYLNEINKALTVQLVCSSLLRS